jgi:N-hydroxyarylamine O-acetyltransferase
VLLVEVDGARWIADVGFGGEGLLLPVPFGDGTPSCQSLWTYRVVPEADTSPDAMASPHARWVMQSLHGGEWIDLYVFTLERQELIDYEVANHYTSTHPTSKFVRTLAVQLGGPGERRLLRNREFTIDRGAATTRELRDDEEILTVLAEAFDLRFPAGTRFAFADSREGRT